MNQTDYTEQRIRELYDRYTRAEATKEELQELFVLSANPANQSTIESLTSETWDELYEKSIDLQRLEETPGRKTATIHPFRWVAAAVLVICLGLYFMGGRKAAKPENIPAVVKTSDVAPGGNKATLVLSTGKTIILDSAGNGQLARFGNTTISKTDSGKLAYITSGSKIDNSETSFNTLSTPRGGVYELTLPDGTKVWLNAASRIDYPSRFSGKTREVFISGEVYFEVAHDATHPFLVSLTAKTRDQGERGHWMQIEVLGTHFNVNTYEDAKTTLLEGSVKISAPGNIKIIKPGEQATAGFGIPGIEIKKEVDIDKVMAWRNGKIALTDLTVRQLMSEISRWYDMDIVYKGAVPNKQFYGSIRRDVPLSTVLHALQAYGVETVVEGNKIIIK